MKKLLSIILIFLVPIICFGTFTVIQTGDPVDAPIAMGNWRHSNYGNIVRAMNSLGVEVNNIIDIGSITGYFKQSYITTGNFNTLDLGTNTIYDENFNGDWNFNSSTLTGISIATITTLNSTFQDLGTNTIYDENFTGDWNFNLGDLSNIGVMGITTLNISTLDLGTNTISDENFTGNWAFNSGALTGIASTVIDNLTLDGNTYTSNGAAIFTLSSGTSFTYNNSASGDFDCIMNNDSHGDNITLQFLAEDAGGNPFTGEIRLDPDDPGFFANRDWVFSGDVNTGPLWAHESTSSSSNEVFKVTSTPGTTLSVRGDGSVFMEEVYSDNLTGTIRNMVVQDDGQIGWGVSSIKYKKNIIDMESINWLYKLRPVNFNYRKKDSEGNPSNECYPQKKYGLIAEEVENIISDFVSYDKKGKAEGVNYIEMISVLIKALQDQNKKIKLMGKRISRLEEILFLEK